MTSDNVEQLLQEARAAIRAGELSVGEAFLRRAAELAPERADIWLELSGVVGDLEEKSRYLVRVLDLQPSNREARASLAWVRKKQGEVIEEEQPANVRLGAIPRVEPSTVEAPAGEEIAPVEQGREEVVYCARHPDVETNLRCNRCGTPICPRCAIRTPVGFRCEACVRAQRSVFYTAGSRDYVVAAVVALILATIAGYIITLVGWFFAIFLGPLAGGLIGDIISRVTGHRRGERLWILAGAALIVGALVPILLPALLYGSVWYALSLYRLLSIGIFLVLGIGAAIARLR